MYDFAVLFLFCAGIHDHFIDVHHIFWNLPRHIYLVNTPVYHLLDILAYITWVPAASLHYVSGIF